MYRLRHNLRSRLYDSIKRKGFNTLDSIGCSWDEFKIHIEFQFKPWMTWENYGSQWSIDHIVPLCTAKNSKELFNLNNYLNMRPLCKIENSSKSAIDRNQSSGQ
jgi:hypothetical protein